MQEAGVEVPTAGKTAICGGVLSGEGCLMLLVFVCHEVTEHYCTGCVIKLKLYAFEA